MADLKLPKVKLDIDTTELDETIEKANHLVSLLNEANGIANSLSSTTGKLTISIQPKATDFCVDSKKIAKVTFPENHD